MLSMKKRKTFTNIVNFKLILLSCALVLLSACEKAESLNNTLKADEVTLTSDTDLSPEELLGKTVEEYTQQQNKTAADAPQQKTEADQSVVKNGYLQLSWDDLIAPGYDPESILAKYDTSIEKLQHGGEEAFILYKKMQEELNNAPANPELANEKVSLPGFIAPLEQNNGMITEFLLVPYFGACIHSPPPPANQTLYVKVAADYAIRSEDVYNPIWVSGALQIDTNDTEIGSASYSIEEALISPYIFEEN